MEENRKAIINGFLDITKHWNDPREFLKDNYDKAIWCAIADFTFRTTDRVPESTADKVGMEGLFNALCPENSEDSLKKRFIHYFEEEQREETEFDTWHDTTCGYVLDTLQKMYNVHYGKAQKIVNMTFKYLYCVMDDKEDYFMFCHVPLDSIILDWIWSIKDQMSDAYQSIIENNPNQKNLPQKLQHGYFKSWSNLDNDGGLVIKDKKHYSYLFYQKLLRAYCKEKGNKYTPLQLEFCAWTQFQWERAATEMCKYSHWLLKEKNLGKKYGAKDLKNVLTEVLNQELKLIDWNTLSYE